MPKIERHIDELYAEDAERADARVFGRRTDVSRRGFLGGAGLAAMSAAVGGSIVHHAHMPGGLIPAAFAQEAKKEPRRGTTAACWPAEAQVPRQGLGPGGAGRQAPGGGDARAAARRRHHADGQVLHPQQRPAARAAPRTPDAWKLTIDGEVNKPLEITLGELKKRLQPETLRMVLECGGNGRSFFTPQARGNQWTNGGVGCAEWTGMPLGDVLEGGGRETVCRLQRPTTAPTCTSRATPSAKHSRAACRSPRPWTSTACWCGP